MSAPVRHLVARTIQLPEPPDLLAEAGDDGFLFLEETGGLAARGSAVSIELPRGLADADAVARVAEKLSEIDTDDTVGLPGCGPVALGALPFNPSAASRLTVPRRIVGRDGDTAWLTTIGEEGDQSSPQSQDSPPDEFRLTPAMPHDEWMQVVREAVDVIRAGALRKVVLARRVDITANRSFVIGDVLSRLKALYPSCTVFHVDGFLGASPELLIRRTGAVVESHPLAGTVARSGDARSDDALVASLMASPKARREHQFVVDDLRGALEEVCSELTVPEAPTPVSLRNVSHLGTRVAGRLAGPFTPSSLQLVARVHPTPAVGGSPTPDAIDYLEKVEGFDRGRYAGPVGWVDARGDGAWIIGIRSAEVEGPRASIFAGNGVVAGSDPDEELVETQLKLQALLAALVRP